MGRATLPPLLHLGGQYGWQIENRNKELKCGLGIDRLSDHRFVANLFRMYLHAAAANLLVRLRREIADPPPMPPGEAPAGAARKRYQNARRRRDPLDQGERTKTRVHSWEGGCF